MDDALRHFLLILDTGTFTEAARRAHLSQPAISSSIRKLEETLGARLLERGAGGARLTAAGKALLPHAQAAVTAVEDGRRSVAEVVGLVAGEVRLGAGPTACAFMLPPVIAAFRRQHPGVRVLLQEARNELVWEALRAGRIDLAIVTGSSVPQEASWVTVEPWLHDELVLVGAPGAPVGAAAISYPEGSVLRKLLSQYFPELSVVMELGSIVAVLAHVREGVGVALTARVAAADDIAAGRLVEIDDPRVPILRELVLAHRGVRRLPPAAAALRAVCLDD